MLGRLKAKGAQLHVLGHEAVRGVAADHYSVRFQPGATTTSNSIYLGAYGFEVWIDGNDLIRRIRITNYTQPQPDNTPPTPAETIEQTIEFYDFGVQADIQPPPADQVTEVPQVPCIPTSPSSTITAASICSGDTGASPSTTIPRLPHPTINGPSDLQLRPVQAVHQSSCTALTTNPAADQPASLPGPIGTCYDLAPAALTITHAGVAAEADQNNQLDVRLTFTSADSAAFDRLATRYYQQQVAIVMFGRVLSAPTINAQQFNGTAIISEPSGGLDPQTAANIQAALAA